jgi:hypothetical protein
VFAIGLALFLIWVLLMLTRPFLGRSRAARLMGGFGFWLMVASLVVLAWRVLP